MTKQEIKNILKHGSTWSGNMIYQKLGRWPKYQIGQTVYFSYSGNAVGVVVAGYELKEQTRYVQEPGQDQWTPVHQGWDIFYHMEEDQGAFRQGPNEGFWEDELKDTYWSGQKAPFGSAK